MGVGISSGFLADTFQLSQVGARETWKAHLGNKFKTIDRIFGKKDDQVDTQNSKHNPFLKYVRRHKAILNPNK